MKRISVVIPTLNEERLLEQMLSQFTPEVIQRFGCELVVSDGGSSDRTLEIARRYAHVVVENEAGVKQNISIGRNRGAAHASGEILVFLNADTMVRSLPEFLERIRGEVSAPAVAAVTCSVMVYPEQERSIDRTYHGFYNWFASYL